jgi:hypothetical protein
MTTFQIVLVVVLLFAGMISFLELGLWLGRRNPGGTETGFSALSGAVFALMGLLLAFTFSGAGARYDAKRQLVVEESNDIGTAYLRIDLLPPARQQPLRESLRRYLDTRVAYYRNLGDANAAKAEMAQTEALQRDIWSQAIVACREGGSNTTNTLVLSSLNTMFDIATTRALATQMHPPGIVFVLLAVLPWICSLLAGYEAGDRSRSLLHILGFALILSITVYIILDYEYPRSGLFVHMDATDQILVDLRQSMNH